MCRYIYVYFYDKWIQMEEIYAKYALSQRKISKEVEIYQISRTQRFWEKKKGIFISSLKKYVRKYLQQIGEIKH